MQSGKQLNNHPLFCTDIPTELAFFISHHAIPERDLQRNFKGIVCSISWPERISSILARLDVDIEALPNLGGLISSIGSCRHEYSVLSRSTGMWARKATINFYDNLVLSTYSILNSSSIRPVIKSFVICPCGLLLTKTYENLHSTYCL